MFNNFTQTKMILLEINAKCDCVCGTEAEKEEKKKLKMIHFTTALNIEHTFIQLYSPLIDEMVIIYCSVQVLAV